MTMLHQVMQPDSLCSELECMLPLPVAANQSAHERHSENLIKVGQHEVLSADGGATATEEEKPGGESSQLCFISC